MSPGVRSGLLIAVLGGWLIRQVATAQPGDDTIQQASGGVQLVSPGAAPPTPAPTRGSAVTAAASVPNPRRAAVQTQINAAIAGIAHPGGR